MSGSPEVMRTETITDPILLFYPVSPVHIRNLALLSGKLPGWTIRVIYSPKLPWFTPEKVASYPYECLPFVDDQVPEAAWTGDVRAVIMSTALVRHPPFNLVMAALARGVPTVAIEEVHQLALQDGRVNNYPLPVDWLLVASEFERRGFIAAGVPSAHVETRGWPFYSGLLEPASIERRALLMAHFGLDHKRPVATLALTMFSPSDATGSEGPDTRRQLLSLVAQGLPQEYQLLVKAHPAEDPATVIPFVEQYAPQAQLVERYSEIQDVLDTSNVLFNQGISQVMIEALIRQLPVIVVPAGVRTAFDDLINDLVVRTPEDVPKALSLLGDNPMAAYRPFCDTHLHIPPQQALEQTARRIEEVANAGQVRDPVERLPELALWQAWRLDRDKAWNTLHLLQGRGANSSLYSALERLIQWDADRQDVAELLLWSGPGLQSYAVKSLWIDTLVQHSLPIQQEDLDWLADYPSQMMRPLFLGYAFRWCGHLLKCGHRQAAEELVGRLAAELGHLKSVQGYVAQFHRLLGRADLAAHKVTPAALSFVGGRARHYAVHPGAVAGRLYRMINRVVK